MNRPLHMAVHGACSQRDTAAIIPECEPARCTTLKRGRTLHGEAATHPPVSCDTRSSSAARDRLYGRGSAPKLRTEP